MTKRGPPAGNQNARTHGAYAEPMEPTADLDARINDLDRRINQLSAYIDANSPMATDDLVKLLSLHGTLTSRLGRLFRDRAALHPEDNDELTAAIHGALDDLAAEWGIEL